MTLAARNQGQEVVGGMSRRTATWLAWSLCALAVALTAVSLLLLALNRADAHTHVYDYWLDNTLGAMSLAPLGALIASRRPANPVGWLLCLNGVAFSIGHFSAQYAIYTLLARPGSLPAGEALAWIASWILPIMIGLQVFSFLLFPTGRLPSDRWKWLAWLTVAFVVGGVITSAFSFGANAGLGPIPNPLGIEGFSNFYDMVMNMLPLLYVAVASSLFVRLRRAVGVERQQIKWFAYAAAATIIGITLAYMIPDTIDTPPLVQAGGVCNQSSRDTSHPRLYGHSHLAVQALRDRPPDQPYPRLRSPHRNAGFGLRRERGGLTGRLARFDGPGVHPGHRRLDPCHSGPVQPVA